MSSENMMEEYEGTPEAPEGMEATRMFDKTVINDSVFEGEEEYSDTVYQDSVFQESPFHEDYYEEAPAEGTTDAMEFVQSVISCAKQMTTDTIVDAMNYFEPKRALYEKVEDIKEVKIPRLDFRLNGLLVWGIVFVIIGAGFKYLFDFINGIELLEGVLEKVPFELMNKVCVILIAVGAVFIVVKILVEVLRFVFIKNYESKIKETEEVLKKYYKASPFVGVIGFDFTSPAVLEELLKAVEDGRANYLSEAINSYCVDKILRLQEEEY